MNKGINKAIIVGNVGSDPEVKYLPSGTGIMEFSVATSESWKDKQGQQQERTEWHKVVVFGKLVETLATHSLINKGVKVYIEGKLQTDRWQAKDGSDRYTTKIQAYTVQVLEPRIGKENHGHKNQAADPIDTPNPSTQSQTEPVFDDDIPF